VYGAPPLCLEAKECSVDEAAGVRLPVSELVCSILFVIPRSAIHISRSSGRQPRLPSPNASATVWGAYSAEFSDARLWLTLNIGTRAAFTLSTKKQKIAHPFEEASPHVSRILCTVHRLEGYGGSIFTAGSTPHVRMCAHHPKLFCYRSLTYSLSARP
jgi:hypothetical protein